MRRTIAGRSIRWDTERAERAYAAGLWVRETLGDVLARTAAKTPERVLVVDGDVRLDARSLHTQASALAQVLTARFAVGSVVSFMLPNWHEAAVIYLATTLAGMIAHPVLPSLREHELRFMLRDAGSRMIFIPAAFRDFDYTALLATVCETLDAPPEVVLVRPKQNCPDSHRDYNNLLDSAAPQSLPVVDADAVRMIMHTSGTTGRPKGVMHSHNSIHALIRQLEMHWLIEPGDTFLVASPISHIGGSIYAFEMPLLLGTTAILMERWDADIGVQLLRRERCTHCAAATPFLAQILTAARKAQTRLPDLKVFACGGASVPPALIREAADYFERAAVTRVYGSTEVPVIAIGVTDRCDVAHAADTDGRLGIAEAMLIDAEDSLVSGDESGEIRARGPQMLVGYVNTEDEATAFDADGFFRTGDLARWVDGDYLVIIGRSKDLIIRNGENIAPKEIEDLLAMHPAIAEIAIVGIPDTKTGERACAVIVPRGEEPPDADGLRVFLEACGVAKFKIPEQVAIWESLPKNDAGKVLKHKIRATLIAASRSG